MHRAIENPVTAFSTLNLLLRNSSATLLDAQIQQQSFVHVVMKLNIIPACTYCIINRT